LAKEVCRLIGRRRNSGAPHFNSAPGCEAPGVPVARFLQRLLSLLTGATYRAYFSSLTKN
jgi:hypothetical protein